MGMFCRPWTAGLREKHSSFTQVCPQNGQHRGNLVSSPTVSITESWTDFPCTNKAFPRGEGPLHLLFAAPDIHLAQRTSAPPTSHPQESAPLLQEDFLTLLGWGWALL